MAKKRGNSEGSIYEDANGYWRASVYVVWANGKQRDCCKQAMRCQDG